MNHIYSEMKYVEYILFRCLVSLISVIPFRLLYLISDGCSFLMQYIFRYRIKTVSGNLKKAFPWKSRNEIKKIAGKFYKNLCDVALESIKGYSLSPEQIQKRYRHLNIEVANRYYEKGLTIIIAMTHYCNWEWGALIAGSVYRHNPVAFYKPMSNKYIDEYVCKKRKQWGLELVSIYNSKSVFRSKGDIPRAYYLISDQYPGNAKKAFWVKFLHQDTACLRGIEEYAKLFGLPVIYLDIQRVERGYYTLTLQELCINPTKTLPGEITENYMKKLETIIIKKPEDWLWSHKRWKKAKPGLTIYNKKLGFDNLVESMKYSSNIYAVIMLLLLSGCSDLIEYSPYDTPVKSHDLNKKNADLIQAGKSIDTDTLMFALFADTHDNYDDMADAIKSINDRPDLRFAVSCGDITFFGLAQEYEWYLETAGGLNCPLITVIGNHDYLANGLDIYRKLFGDQNISFTCGKYKFIVFDCAMRENYNVSPEYEWLISELSDSSHVKVFISHIAPFADDVDHLNRLVLNNILKSGNVKLCLHGHFHNFSEVYYNDIHTIVADEIKSREYYIIKLTGDQSFVETIKF